MCSNMLQFVFILAVLIATSRCQNVSKTKDGIGQPPQLIPDSGYYDKGLQTLYDMTNTFLKVIQPYKDNSLYEELGLSKETSNGAKSLQSILDNVSTSDQIHNWQFWARYFVGFSVCVAFGVVFVVCMPIAGLIFFCCRCCGRCGSKSAEKPERRRDKTWRIILSLLFAFITMLILAGAVCAFMTNAQVQQKTSNTTNGAAVENQSMMSTITNGLQILQIYSWDTFSQIKVLLTYANKTVSATLQKVENFSTIAVDNLSRITGADKALDQLIKLSNDVDMLDSNLYQIQSDSSYLQRDLPTLNQSITAAKENLTHLLNCTLMPPTSNCTQILKHVQYLTFDADMSSLPNVSSQLAVIGSIKNDNFSEQINNAVNASIRLKNEIDEKSNFLHTAASDSRKLFDGLLDKALREVDEVNKSLSLSSVIQSVNDVSAEVSKYGDYRFYVCVSISAFLLLIVLINICGLCFGAFGKAPGYGSPNRTAGACCFMLTAVLIFIFSFALMLVVMVLFVVGGIAQTEGCRGFTEHSDTTAVKVVNSVLKSTFNQTDISIFNLLDNCNNNMALYKALNLENYLHILNDLDLQNFNDFDKSFNMSFGSLSSGDLMSDHLNNSLRLLAKLSLDNITLSLLNRNATNYSNDQLIIELTYLAANTNDSDLKSGLDYEIQRLNQISNRIERVHNISSNITNSLKIINEILTVKEFAKVCTSVADQLISAQTMISQNGSFIAEQISHNFQSQIISELSGLIETVQYKVLNDIGQCRPVYVAAENIIRSICLHTLRPFNGFWFSFGWCVFFFIPGIIIAICLVNLNRKTEFDVRNFDAPNYDAYKLERYPSNQIFNSIGTDDSDHRLNNYTSNYDDQCGDTSTLYSSNGNHLRNDRVSGILNPVYYKENGNGYHLPRPTTIPENHCSQRF